MLFGQFFARQLCLVLVLLAGLANSSYAEPQPIEDLLKSVDDTLNSSQTKSKDQNPKNKVPKESRSKDAPVGQASEQVRQQVLDSEVAKKSLSTPQVFEVPTNVSINRSRSESRKNRLFFGTNRRTHLGGGQLEQDDDTFDMKPHQSVIGFTIGADRELWNASPLQAQPSYMWFLGANVEGYRGDAIIDRRGVYSETIERQMTWLAWFMRTEICMQLTTSLSLSGIYGFGGETINQTGQGVTDSASEAFSTDKLGVGVSYEFADSMAMTLSIDRRSTVIVRNKQSPKALAMGLHLTTRL